MGLLPQEFKRLNDQLMVQVQALDMPRLPTVHIFLPIAGNKEPDTYAVAKWLRNRYPGIRLVLPKTERNSQRMEHIIWDTETTLARNHWGIPEPEQGATILPQEIDVVFLPLLVFDEQGNRIGYGKGFYDRFLAECLPTARKIGLSLFEAVETISDVSSHDVVMDMCVTPTRIWSFSTAP